MKESLILDKSNDFAIRVVKLYQYLCDKKNEPIMSKQLLRAGTSVGANLHEAQYAQSKADFISKNSIALKEAAETGYWLNLLHKTNYLSAAEFNSMNNDCKELIKILTSIIKSLKK